MRIDLTGATDQTIRQSRGRIASVVDNLPKLATFASEEEMAAFVGAVMWPLWALGSVVPRVAGNDNGRPRKKQ